MTWRLVLLAVDQPRIQARVLQIVDHLLLPIESFSSNKLGEQISIRLSLEADERQIRRVESLLRRLQGVRQVDAHSDPSPSAS